MPWVSFLILLLMLIWISFFCPLFLHGKLQLPSENTSILHNLKLCRYYRTPSSTAAVKSYEYSVSADGILKVRWILSSVHVLDHILFLCHSVGSGQYLQEGFCLCHELLCMYVCIISVISNYCV
jgi:hypothetical protein